MKFEALKKRPGTKSQKALSGVYNQSQKPACRYFYGESYGYNQLLERRQQRIEHPEVNPFVDDKAWGAYLGERREALVKFCDEN